MYFLLTTACTPMHECELFAGGLYGKKRQKQNRKNHEKYTKKRTKQIRFFQFASSLVRWCAGPNRIRSILDAENGQKTILQLCVDISLFIFNDFLSSSSAIFRSLITRLSLLCFLYSAEYFFSLSSRSLFLILFLCHSSVGSVVFFFHIYLHQRECYKCCSVDD